MNDAKIEEIREAGRIVSVALRKREVENEAQQFEIERLTAELSEAQKEIDNGQWCYRGGVDAGRKRYVKAIETHADKETIEDTYGLAYRAGCFAAIDIIKEI